MKRRRKPSRKKFTPNKSGTWVYVMLHIPFVWWCKIGITGQTAEKRAKNLDAAMFGFPLPIFAVPIPFAWHVEQWLHGLCAPMSVDFYSGDGHSEWFWLPAAVVAIPVLSALFILSVVFWIGIIAIAATWMFGDIFNFKM